jgi:hypothetical protein
MFSVRLQLLELPVLRGPLLSGTRPNPTRELAGAERSQNSLPCCLPSKNPPVEIKELIKKKTFAARYKQRIYQLDYVAAFLQADIIGRKFTFLPTKWK